MVIDPIETMETFCDEYNEKHLYVFLEILYKMKLPEQLKTKIKEGHRLITEFIEYCKNGFLRANPRMAIRDILLYIINILSDITTSIEIIHQKLYHSPYSTNRYRLLKKYEKGFKEWKHLTDPLINMIAVTRENNFKRVTHANSRVVNTLNRTKRIVGKLPTATPYTGYNQWTHRNELPIGTFIQPELSPRKINRTKKYKYNSREVNLNSPVTPTGTRPKGTRII